jgi:hypothetical protein
VLILLGEVDMKTLYMTDKQKKIIQLLFKTGRTYHGVATEAGIENRPDKFEDLSYDMAKQIIKAHGGLLGLR